MSQAIQNPQEKATVTRHWPVVLLALVVVVIFLVVMMSFQVKETEFALLKTYSGKLIPYPAGLHFRWPLINQVWRHDKRIQCYELEVGHDEQYMTKDNQQIVISTYVLWRVGEPQQFMKALGSTEAAERKINDEVRGTRSAVISRKNFKDMVSPVNGARTLADIENEMLAPIRDSMLKEYGITIVKIGFRQLGFPPAVTTNIYETMIAERESQAKRYIDEGEREASEIRSNAEAEASRITTSAAAQATKIRGEGDAAAAKHYEAFAADPELAAFIRSLEALRNALGERDTLVLDTGTAPFNWLAPNALKSLKSAPAPAAPAPRPGPFKPAAN